MGLCCCKAAVESDSTPTHVSNGVITVAPSHSSNERLSSPLLESKDDDVHDIEMAQTDDEMEPIADDTDRGLTDTETLTGIPETMDKVPLAELGWMLSMEKSRCLQEEGYCRMDGQSFKAMTSKDRFADHQIGLLIRGWIRQISDEFAPTDICCQIFVFCDEDSCDRVLQLQSGGPNPSFFLISRQSLKLSTKLCDFESASFQVDGPDPQHKVKSDTLHHVVRYLAHHKGVEPDPLPCPVRSAHLSQCVSDEWDATFMDAFQEKGPVFDIITTAHYLGIQSLLHLGCAKIAILIKQLDQNEINRIIEEEEEHRRTQNEDGGD